MSTKVAVIGAGGMLEYHAAGFQKAGADIVAIADIDAQSASRAATEWKVKHSFGDPSKMLADVDCDAVSIIVPNKYHASIAIDCLNAGKHVFCEKPPALNAAEVELMMAAAHTAGKRLMFNFNNRARPESYAIMDRINDGTIGTINSAQAKWIRRTGIPGFGGWFTTKSVSGGGPLIDLLHMLDLAMYFMGYPEPVHVLGQTFDNFITDRQFKGPWGIPDNESGTTDVESAAHGFVLFSSGQVLTIQASWAEMIKREEVSVVFQGSNAGGKVERLFGTDGLDETSMDTCEVYFQKNGSNVDQTIDVPECEDMGRSRSAENFIRSIEGDEAPLNTPDQALVLMKVIDAMYQSAQASRPVSIG